MDVEEVFARFRAIKHAIAVPKRSTSPWFGEHRSAARGAGFEVAGVDAWRPGQPLKDVSWRLSLRSYPEVLYKVERTEPRQIPTLFLVDLSASTLFEISRDSNKALLLLDLVGAIGLTRARLHDPVGLLAYSDRIESFVKPKPGTAQIFRIAHELFDRLALVRRSAVRRRADLSVALRFAAAHLRVRHSVVIVSDLVDLVGDEDALDYQLIGRVGWKHEVSVLVLDDPDEFKISTRLGFLRMENMETGTQTVVPARRLPLLRRGIDESLGRLRTRLKRECGVDSEVFTPGDHFESLARFLARRSAR